MLLVSVIDFMIASKFIFGVLVPTQWFMIRFDRNHFNAAIDWAGHGAQITANALRFDDVRNTIAIGCIEPDRLMSPILARGDTDTAPDTAIAINVCDHLVVEIK